MPVFERVNAGLASSIQLVEGAQNDAVDDMGGERHDRRHGAVVEGEEARDLELSRGSGTVVLARHSTAISPSRQRSSRSNS